MVCCSNNLFVELICTRAMLEVFMYLSARNINNPDELIGNKDLLKEIQDHFFYVFVANCPEETGKEYMDNVEVFEVIVDMTQRIAVNERENPALMRFKKFIHDLLYEDDFRCHDNDNDDSDRAINVINDKRYDNFLNLGTVMMSTTCLLEMD